MHLRIYTLIYCAILFGFATVGQSYGQPSNDIHFSDDDDDIEGSGNDREVAHDLEASGSGLGPDDEDTPRINYPVVVSSPPINKDTDFIQSSKPVDNNKPEPADPTEDRTVVMNPKPEDRPTSFFAQPGILAAIIGGAVVGLLCAILVVMFIVYRMRKKDEGSYALGEPKQSPTANSYSRGTNKEFYA